MATITWLDEGGLDPLNVGIAIAIYPLGTQLTTDNLATSIVVGIGGITSATLAASSEYVALFSGVYAPASPMVFATPADGSDFTVSVGSFRSSFLSQPGYVAAQKRVWPKKWIGSAVPATPVAESLANGFAVVLALLDAQAQAIRAVERLNSCTGSQIDFWVRNYCGGLLPRYPFEADANYVNRIEAVIGSERNTLAAVLRVVLAWEASTSTGPRSPHGFAIGVSGAIGVDGGIGVKHLSPPSVAGAQVESTGITGGVGVQGGIGLPVIPVQLVSFRVFDLQTDPVNSAVVNITPKSGLFCVAMVYSNVSNPLSVIGPFSPALDHLISLVRPSGYLPVYATNQPQ